MGSHFLRVKFPEYRNGKAHAYALVSLRDLITGNEYSVTFHGHKVIERLTGLWLIDNYQQQLLSIDNIWHFGVNILADGKAHIDSECDWTSITSIANAVGISLVRHDDIRLIEVSKL